MEDLCRTIDSEQLRRAWSILNEYHDFCRLACYRKKLEEQLRVANIPLTYVPWKSMVRALLCQSLFSDTELKEMNGNTEGCYTAADIASSEPTIDFLLENSEKDEGDFTETWFEIDELKQRFQRAMNIFPTNRRAQKEMLHKVLGYPIGKVILMSKFD